MIQTYLYNAIEASVNAGALIMDIYENQIVEVETKADNSPVTIADQKANDYIEEALQSTGIPVMSEEGEHAKFEVRKNWNQCWIVDPLDGTKEFIKRNGEFTVNIALVENGKPILGVIYIPAQKALYYAITAEQKAFKIELAEHNITADMLQHAVEIFPANESDVITITSSRSYTNQQIFDLIAKFEGEQKQTKLIKAGSSLKFCLMAEGKASYYPRYAPTMEWDTAAGHAICNAVGLEAYDLETNKPLKYNKENLLNPWFLVRKK
ncbi:3'(2'),5'-bisphosphate nucleotidase CysQ [Kordia sp. YSTF-M3]|uniref:3'(2'),5'-bisphosphate nucleotidase CysQ n=1 Tax=Kordia aestuariivivens TaxID=2759037 RepID=A0ABR7Q9W0_9FLAO|nr:3'(2'),5'-bisphosphate nucleotidase CysQ [Kordia aestuariivivens]MBC8755351.1 3'(2'),5'-bisphosphate nucleotidase CysQ [Kordia aestuariivivens]